MEGGRERWGKRGKKGERAKVLGTLDVANCTIANPKDCRVGWGGVGKGMVYPVLGLPTLGLL